MLSDMTEGNNGLLIPRALRNLLEEYAAAAWAGRSKEDLDALAKRAALIRTIEREYRTRNERRWGEEGNRVWEATFLLDRWRWRIRQWVGEGEVGVRLKDDRWVVHSTVRARTCTPDDPESACGWSDKRVGGTFQPDRLPDIVERAIQEIRDFLAEQPDPLERAGLTPEDLERVDARDVLTVYPVGEEIPGTKPMATLIRPRVFIVGDVPAPFLEERAARQRMINQHARLPDRVERMRGESLQSYYGRVQERVDTLNSALQAHPQEIHSILRFVLDV